MRFCSRQARSSSSSSFRPHLEPRPPFTLSPATVTGRLLHHSEPLQDVHVSSTSVHTRLRYFRPIDRSRPHSARPSLHPVSVEPHAPQDGSGTPRPQPGTFSTFHRLLPASVAQDPYEHERLPIVHPSSAVEKTPNIRARQIVKLSPSALLPI